MVKKKSVHRQFGEGGVQTLVGVDNDQLERLSSYIEKELPEGLHVSRTAKVRMVLERFLKSVGA